MTTGFRWYGDVAIRRINDEIDVRLNRAAAAAVTFIKLQVSLPVKSRPGGYPGLRSGNFRNSIGYKKVRPGKYFIGTNSLVGKYLQFGTSNMRPRPWLTKSLSRVSQIMNRAVGRGRII